MPAPEWADDAFCYLTTTGRRSGRPHTIEIWFAEDAGRLFLMAGGRDRADWVRNLRADPSVHLRVGSFDGPAVARVVEGDADDALARRLLAAKYQGWEPGAQMSEWASTALPVVVVAKASQAGGRASPEKLDAVRLPRALAAIVLVASLVAMPGGPAGAQPPAGNISKNVEFVANIPEMKSAIAINFIGDTMFVSTAHGLYAYSVSDPSAPSLLSSLPMYIWENEDMAVDEDRNLVFIARDPRGFTSPATPGSFPYGAIHIVDVSLGHAMTTVNTFQVDASHTATCINDCDFLWTGGPAKGVQQPAEWGGRPVFGYDVTDPMNPVPCPEPIDVGRNDGVTDYAHDVQVDAAGVAWVSGAGGVRGYWTSGKHKNPLTGKKQKATACEPIPYAGGGSPEKATPSRFMHNSWRNMKAKVGGKKGAVLYGTEENLSSDCRTSGRFTTYDLRGSYNGEGWKNIAKTKFRMKALDWFTPEGQEGSEGCDSAHYFSDRGDQMLAAAFYGAGTRFLDVSNPKNIRQVGYYVPSDANTWAAYWRDGYVYVADFDRGVDILKFGGSSSSKTVTAPAVDASTPTEQSSLFRFMCPLPLRQPI